jgi:hypothetical protein
MLQQLPDEIIENIAINVDCVRDYIALSSVNKEFQHRLSRPLAWKSFLMNIMGNDVAFILLFLLRRIDRSTLMQTVFNTFLSASDLVSATNLSVADMERITFMYASKSSEKFMRLLKSYLEHNEKLDLKNTALEVETLSALFVLSVREDMTNLTEFLLESSYAPVLVHRISEQDAWYYRLLHTGRSTMFTLLLQHGARAEGSVHAVVQAIADTANVPALDAYISSLVKPEEKISAIQHAWNVASYEGLQDFIVLLITKYHIEPQAEQFIAVRWCCRRGYHRLLQTLFTYGLEPAEIEDEMPLYLAIRNGHIEVVRVLIKNGIDIHAHQEAMLRESSRLGLLPMVQILVESGADVSAMNYEALRMAQDSKHNDIYQYLISDIQSKNQNLHEIVL